MQYDCSKDMSVLV